MTIFWCVGGSTNVSGPGYELAMNPKKNKYSIPKPLKSLSIAKEISKSQFISKPTFYINKLKKGDAFYINIGGDFLYIYPPYK